MKSKIIYDNHGRPITYLRLAVTDRCNLRCFYCMPEQGIQYLPKKELLTFEEMERVVRILVNMGIEKVRITGGEPFVRQDLMKFLRNLTRINGLKQIAITTNGVLTAPHLEDLKALGINTINLSLDSLDPDRFYKITRRNEYHKVWDTLMKMMEMDFDIKVNCVVMKDRNEQDIIPFVIFTRDHPIEVRFIEEMPFNGDATSQSSGLLNRSDILNLIRTEFPLIQKNINEPHSTSENYTIEGHLGKIGIIAAYSRTFCGSCNRIRITAQGMLKNCLYDEGVLSVKSLLRSGLSDQEITKTLLATFQKRLKDGFEAEKQRIAGNPVSESMATIGG